MATEIVESAGGWFREGGTVDPMSMHLGIDEIVRALKRHEAVLAAVDDTVTRDAAVA